MNKHQFLDTSIGIPEKMDFLLEYFEYYPDRILNGVERSRQYIGDNFEENRIKRRFRTIKEFGIYKDGNRIYCDVGGADVFWISFENGVNFGSIMEGIFYRLMTWEEFDEYTIALRNEFIKSLNE